MISAIVVLFGVLQLEDDAVAEALTGSRFDPLPVRASYTTSADTNCYGRPVSVSTMEGRSRVARRLGRLEVEVIEGPDR
ncbi:MAG: hypothetical protein KJO11_08400, partial [Gemmatimonadetes bacterium]|nr:hypothetical protein [Gemmatimonadota bacterium]